MVFRQSVLTCPFCSCEVLAEEAVLRLLGKFQQGDVVCPAAVKDWHLGESDIYYCDGGSDEVDGVDSAPRAMLEVPAEDRQGSLLLACVVSEYSVVSGRE